MALLCRWVVPLDAGVPTSVSKHCYPSCCPPEMVLLASQFPFSSPGNFCPAQMDLMETLKIFSDSSNNIVIWVFFPFIWNKSKSPILIGNHILCVQACRHQQGNRPFLWFGKFNIIFISLSVWHHRQWLYPSKTDTVCISTLSPAIYFLSCGIWGLSRSSGPCVFECAIEKDSVSIPEFDSVTYFSQIHASGCMWDHR